MMILQLCFAALISVMLGGDPPGGNPQTPWPLPLEQYNDSHVQGILEILKGRVERQPANLAATIIFFCAVIHTFLTARFRHIAHALDQRGDRQILARLVHFFGEVEAVFGIWVIPLVVILQWMVSWEGAIGYLNTQVHFEEAVFVVVIMTIAGSRPVLALAERLLRAVARIGGSTPASWWFTLLSVTPILGSFITEPAAMTIGAVLLSRQFFGRDPSPAFAYATLGLLFVNISVGGVLTNFAAPPVLMVAARWNWSTPFMLQHFGVPAVLGILAANSLYGIVFRKHFARLAPIKETGSGHTRTAAPAWVTMCHLAFIAWSVYSAHHTVMLIGGFLAYLAFFEVTEDYQDPLNLRPPLLVGFFIAGLVVHGGLQQWWIAPLLRGLGELPLLLGAVALTAFNDNAAITYLASLVPDLTEGLRIAVVSGAVVGGGLTVIANAPNPAGQAILGKFFPTGISPARLLAGAIPPTILMGAMFLLFQ
jgi:hypothetical protein